MKRVWGFTLALAAVVFCMAGQLTAVFAAEPPEALVERYSGMLDRLRVELTDQVPKIDLEKAKTAGSPEEKKLIKFLASDKLDKKLVKYVVLHDATPKGLAEFEAQGKEQAALIKRLLADDELMMQMVMAGGARSYGRGGPAAYGEAMIIYTRIQKASEKDKDGVLQRLALAGSVNQAGGAAGAIARVKTQAKNKAKKEGKPEVAVPESALTEAVEKHYQQVVQH